MSTTRIAAQLARDRDDALLSIRVQQAIINAVGIGTVDLFISGDVESVVQGVKFLDSYELPLVGDTVWVIANGPDRIVIGRVALTTRPRRVEVVALVDGVLTNGTAVGLLNAQFAAEGGVRYKATMSWDGVFGTVAGDIIRQTLNDTADPALTAKASVRSRIDVAGSLVHQGGSYSIVWTPPAGDRTISWLYQRTAGTGTVAVYAPGTSLLIERFDD